MDINKAIRKQEKSNKRFLLVLGFIFLSLPMVLVLTNKVNIFFLIYLGVIELLIMVTILISMNSIYLNYNSDGYKLKIKFKRFAEELIILCEKVVMVYAEGEGSQMDIILLTSSRFRNKKINAVDENFLMRYPVVGNYYYRIKKSNPENNYFYIIISKGGYHKYNLLDLIYRTCVNAQYADEAVERIKVYRRS